MTEGLLWLTDTSAYQNTEQSALEEEGHVVSVGHTSGTLASWAFLVASPLLGNRQEEKEPRLVSNLLLADRSPIYRGVVSEIGRPVCSLSTQWRSQVVLTWLC